MIIGVDIGGTHTDAVLVEGQQVIDSVKIITDETSFFRAVHSLKRPSVKAIKLGTTCALNALIEKRGLYRVGVIRLAGHGPLITNHLADSITIGGGFEYDGRPITTFSLSALDEAVEKLMKQGMESLAIVGAFASFYPDQELECLNHVKHKFPDLPLTLSHQMGGIGFIERENATILNAALKKTIKETFSSLKEELDCPLILTQNNGSMLTYEEALEKPILTLSSGATNSFIGAAKLARVDHAIIVDIGGTSTDIGIVKNGAPRRTFATSSIGNVSLQFPMPDVISLGIGGGSHISLHPLTVGPTSSAKNLLKEARSFGGSQITLTDIALCEGHLSIPNALKIDLEETGHVFPYVVERIEREIARMEVSHDIPIILVGGGASMIPARLLSQRYILPDHYQVANAYGAAFAEKSYSIDRVLPLEKRDEILESLKEELIDHLEKDGCRKSRIDQIEVTPYSYLPGNLARYQLSGRGLSD